MDISLLVISLLILTMALSIFTALTRRKRIKVVFDTGEARPVEVHGDRVWLGDTCELEYGYAGYTRVQSMYGAPSVKTWWKKTGTMYSDNIYIGDLCSRPPLVVRSNGFASVEAPGARITSGPRRDDVIICIDTTSVKAGNMIHLDYREGIIGVFIDVRKGVFKTRVEWTTYGGLKKRTNRVLLELCSRKYRECISILRLLEPGVYEKTIKYPLIRQVLATRVGRDLEKTLEKLTEDLPWVFGVDDVYIRVIVKRGLLRSIVREARLMAY